jgi:hypothetical protein
MIKINNLTSEYKQSLSITLDGKITFILTLEFMPQQLGWFYSIQHKTTTLRNKKLKVATNILYQYQNTLPFGIMCVTADGYEPYFIDDFTDGRVELYVYDQNEFEQLKIVYE